MLINPVFTNTIFSRYNHRQPNFDLIVVDCRLLDSLQMVKHSQIHCLGVFLPPDEVLSMFWLNCWLVYNLSDHMCFLASPGFVPATVSVLIYIYLIGNYFGGCSVITADRERGQTLTE